MQVGLSQLLRVPPDTAHSAGGRDALPTQSRQTTPQSETPQTTAVSTPAPAVNPASVVLKIQAPGTAAARDDELVYSSKGLLARAPEGMALEPAGTSASAHTASDFVSHAVSAMRQFTDDAERRKRYAQLDAAPAPQATVGHLDGLKKLSARFSLFA